MNIIKDLYNLTKQLNWKMKTPYDNQKINEAFNNYLILDEKEFNILEVKKVDIKSILYSKYYWFSKFKKEYEKAYGLDIGIEQTQYKLIEEIEQRLKNEQVDWDLLQKIEEMV